MSILNKRKLQQIYQEFRELGNFSSQKGIPFCQICKKDKFCCWDGSITSTVFIFPFEKEFIEKNLRKQIKTIRIQDEESEGEIEILKGTLKSKCPFFNKGICKIYFCAPLCCRLYPYSISYEETPQKGFYLVRHAGCLIKSNNQSLPKVKKLCRELINSLPQKYWQIYDEIDAALFGNINKPKESYKIISLLKLIRLD